MEDLENMSAQEICDEIHNCIMENTDEDQISDDDAKALAKTIVKRLLGVDL